MWKEYLNKTPFVILHVSLVLLYVFFLGRSYRLLMRERGTLKKLERDIHEQEIDPLLNVEDEGRHQLANITIALEKSRDTALIKQLKALTSTTSVGEDFDSRKVLEQVARSISPTDDIIRFCINGLVIVGLMGTLYAFYQMWQTHGAANLTAANSTLYLESMSTALVVSFVGLILALITNFFFSILKARRQMFLESVSTFLIPVARMVPTESKTNLLLTNLLAPLNRLVEQITLQNDQVLRGLTEAVNTRTEQLNRLIESATENWQTAIKDFRSETLTAVKNLQLASGNLADSSKQVASIMLEVSRGLERTKDIGRIVGQLETVSERIIKRISNKLDDSTTTWEKTLSHATGEYESSLQRQSELLNKISRELATQVIADVNAIVAQALATLDALKTKFAENSDSVSSQLLSTLAALETKFAESIEAISAKWMTEMSANTANTAQSLKEVVSGWQSAVSETTHSVNTTLVESRELTKTVIENVKSIGEEITTNVRSLSEEITKLRDLAQREADRTGAPVYLAKVVEQLGETQKSLEILASKLDYGQVLNDLQKAVNTNSGEIVNFRNKLENINNGNINKDVINSIGDIKIRLSDLQSNVSDLPTRIRQTSRSTYRKPIEKQSRWSALRDKLPWTKRQNRDEGQEPSSDKDETA
jgi:biopolymer transport protein ExbB/TolQ